MKHPSHSGQIIRLKRLSGQVNGVIKMIEDQRYCVDILTQIKAAKSALKSVESNIVESHLNHCVSEVMSQKNEKAAQKMISEIKEILRSATK